MCLLVDMCFVFFFAQWKNGEVMTVKRCVRRLRVNGVCVGKSGVEILLESGSDV